MGVVRWSDEVLKYAADMWKAGETAKHISESIEATYGLHFTRDAVIGKLSREGFSRIQLRKKKNTTFKPITLNGVNHQVPLSQATPKQCRYTEDKPSINMVVCGSPVYEHYSYCYSCCKIAYTEATFQKAMDTRKYQGIK